MNNRVQRVNALIERELSKIFLREVDFPEGVLVTITRVATSSNLIQAKVYVSVLPVEKAAIVLKILGKIIFGLQKNLDKRLKMRPVPRIKFVQEAKTQEAAKIEQILEELKKDGDILKTE